MIAALSQRYLQQQGSSQREHSSQGRNAQLQPCTAAAVQLSRPSLAVSSVAGSDALDLSIQGGDSGRFAVS
jgi:hypothetical protein